MSFCKDIILRDKEACFYFKYLAWDSDFFKRHSYSLDTEKSNLIVSEVIKKEIKTKLENSFITVKLDTSMDYSIVDYLQKCGFTYIDTEIILEDTKNRCYIKNIDNIQVVKEKRNEKLPYDKLGDSFSLTRFHTDLNISNTKANTLWINYLKNYHLSDSKHMFSAKVNNELAGIILVNINKKIATLFFVAVIEKFRGQGIGTILVDKASKYFKNYTIRTETQVKNIGALNFYISNGLTKVHKTLTVLHRW